MSENAYKYWAFISYSHQDRRWGNWLHRTLENYRVPGRLVGAPLPPVLGGGEIPRKLFPVFRDRDELPSSADLGGVINEALRQSRYLIVICSPRSATSHWVDSEIRYFKSLGRANRVLCLIVDGEPNAEDQPQLGVPECLPSAVRFQVDIRGELSSTKAEPVAADARGGKDGRANASLKLIAGLLGVSFDELRQRERRRNRLRQFINFAASTTAILLCVAAWHWQQTRQQQALAAQELKTHIAQVYESGRQELLAHNEARAAVFLNEAYKLGVDTPALRFMLGRAMRVVDAQILRINTGAPVFAVEWSPDGEQLMTTSDNRRVQVWDTRSGNKLMEIDPGPYDVVCSSFAPQGSLIWVQTWRPDGQVIFQIWDTRSGVKISHHAVRNTGECPKAPINAAQTRSVFVAPDQSIVISNLDSAQILRLPGRFSAAAFCGTHDSILAGGSDGNVALRDASNGRRRKNYPELGGKNIGSINVFSSVADCSTVAAGANDGSVRVWAGDKPHLTMSGGHTLPVYDLQLSSDAKNLLSSSRNGANVWGTQNGALVYSARFQAAEEALVRLSPDGQKLAYLDTTQLKIVDSTIGKETYSFDGHTGLAKSFGFSKSEQRFATGGTDNIVAIWRLPRDLLGRFVEDGDPARLHLTATDVAPTTPVAFNHRGDQFFVGGDGGVGELRNAETLQIRRRLIGHSGPLSAVAFSSDDSRIATGSWDRSVRIWNTENGDLLRSITNVGGRIWNVAFDRSGRWLSAAAEGRRTSVWDIETGQVVSTFSADWADAHDFSPERNSIAVGVDGRLNLWNLQTQTMIWSQKISEDALSGQKIRFVRFSPNGRELLATAENTRLFLFDSQSGKVLNQIEISSSSGFNVASFSPNGRLVVVGDSGRTFLWNTVDNKVLTLTGHISYVNAAVFSADSSLIFTAGDDGNIKVWSANDGALLDTLGQQSSAIRDKFEVFGYQGKGLLTGGADNSANLWDVPKEMRTWQQLGKQLRCKVPWKLSGTVLTSAPPQTSNCPP